MSMTRKKLVFHENGEAAEVLRVEEDVLRGPGEGEVLAKVLAAPVNPADLNTIQGNYGVKLELPAVPGVEGCGEVVESSDARYAPGDRVIFLHRADTWASHTVVAADSVFGVPREMDVAQAAMLKVNPATAWRALHGFVDLKPGDWVVQNAGNSAVSGCLVQLAREMGVRTVSFVRRAELVEEVRVLGGDVVVLDDEDGRAQALDAMGGAKAKLASNSVGGESALRLMKLLCEGGTHVTYGAMSKKPVTLPNGLLIFRDIRVRGLWVTRWIERAGAEEVRATYETLAERVVAGKLSQKVDSLHGLEDFREALRRLDAKDRAGKVLFRP